MNLIFYMKSGNKIVADKVTNWNIKCKGNEIVSLTLEQNEGPLFGCRNKLIVGSIDLSQIEMIVRR